VSHGFSAVTELLFILTTIFQVDQNQNVFILDFVEAGVRVMEVVVTTGAIIRAKLQSNHYRQQTNTQLYRTDALPVIQPTVSTQPSFLFKDSSPK